MPKTATHPEVLARLKRAEGHLKATIAMIEGGRECLDIAQQLFAVEKALVKAKRELIHDHIGHCLDDEIGAHKGLEELKELAKFLS